MDESLDCSKKPKKPPPWAGSLWHLAEGCGPSVFHLAHTYRGWKGESYASVAPIPHNPLPALLESLSPQQPPCQRWAGAFPGLRGRCPSDTLCISV